MDTLTEYVEGIMRACSAGLRGLAKLIDLLISIDTKLENIDTKLESIDNRLIDMGRRN
jgi:hypothetical protein